jgi:hypothetical protein
VSLQEAVNDLERTTILQLDGIVNSYKEFISWMEENERNVSMILRQNKSELSQKQKAGDSIKRQITKERLNLLALENQVEKDQVRLNSMLICEIDYVLEAHEVRKRFEQVYEQFQSSKVAIQYYLEIFQTMNVPECSQKLKTSGRDELKFESCILNDAQETQLLALLEDFSFVEVTLLYKGSRDGYGAADFHRLCDFQGPSLTVITSTSGHVFGGFASSSWTSDNHWTKAVDSWLFMIKEEMALKYAGKPGIMRHLFGDAGCGVVFGSNRELCVSDSCDRNLSNLNAGSSFFNLDNMDMMHSSGNGNFLVKEIEVFKVVQPSRPVESKILSSAQFAQISEWLSRDPRKRSICALIYRGSIDGFKAKSFHHLCDDIGATLTVVRSTMNEIFGGYTSQSWKSDETYCNVNDSWLFTLTYLQPAIFKAKPDVQDHMYNGSNCMMTFGGGHDLFISDGCDGNEKSFCKGNYSFDSQDRHPEEFLCGAFRFQVSEIEVFQVI